MIGTLDEKQKTLGGLIEALDAACAGCSKSVDARPAVVRIEWNSMKIGRWNSYRGYYEHLALDFHMPRDRDVADIDIFSFRDTCRDLIGSTIIGYKGGEYKVSSNTALWVSEYGSASGVAITGFKQVAGMFLLETAIID